jgi:hypothetical protein
MTKRAHGLLALIVGAGSRMMRVGLLVYPDFFSLANNSIT